MLALGCATSNPPRYGYQPTNGDLIFQSLPHSPLIDAIEGSTHSPYSHMGIVVERKSKWQVLEAIGPVRYTPLNRWIAQGRDDAFAVYRLKVHYRQHIPRFIKAAESYLKRPYDIRYRMDDEAIYCSELVWKAFKQVTDIELGFLTRLGDLSWRPYEEVIRMIEEGGLPLEREIITPVELSRSEILEKVYRRGFTPVRPVSARP